MTIKHGKYTIKIEQDLDCTLNPRKEYDNLATMVCFHKRYDLGDKHEYRKEDYNSWEALEKEIEKLENPAVILPVYMYDHSGLTISTSKFSCPWDSGQIGFIFISREKLLKEFGKKKISKKLLEQATKNLLCEVDTYDQYLSGEVYGYRILDEDGEELDSCWGFYGYEYCELEAKAYCDRMAKRDEKVASSENSIGAGI